MISEVAEGNSLALVSLGKKEGKATGAMRNQSVKYSQGTNGW